MDVGMCNAIHLILRLLRGRTQEARLKVNYVKGNLLTANFSLKVKYDCPALLASK